MLDGMSQRFHEVPQPGKLEFIMSEKPINISVDNKWSKWKCIARNTTRASTFLEVLNNPG